MHILFMPQAGSLGLGGLTRCKAVAREALLRGHSVSFFCHPEMMVRYSDLGAPTYPAPVPKVRGYGAAPNFRITDSIVIRGMDDIEYLTYTTRAELDLYSRIKPDLVFTENQFSSAISARAAGIPLVTTAASVNLESFSSPLYNTRDSHSGIEKNFNNVLRNHALPEVRSITELYHGYSAINVAPTIYEIEPDLSILPNILYVGPILDSSIELGPRPARLASISSEFSVYVYMSVGTLPPSHYVPILCEVSSRANVTFYVSLREPSYLGSPLPASIGSVFLFESLPGLVCIKRSYLVVTRGGQNTLMASILAERPIVGFPGHSAEADFNLRTLERYPDVSRYLINDFTVERLQQLIATARVFRPSNPYALLARRLRRAGGPAAVLSAMERLFD